KSSAPRTKPVGYDNGQAAKMYRERTERIYGTDYPVLYWLNRYSDQIKSLFDFGGHIGVHFYSYASYFDYSNLSQWKICDVPAVLQEAKKFEKYDGNSILRFSENFEECEGFDLFL